MKNLLRFAAFRALAPDDGAGGGAAPTENAAPEAADFDLDASIDAAYEAANRDGNASEEKPTGETTTDEETVADAESKGEETTAEGTNEEKTDEEAPADEATEEDASADDAPADLPAEIVEQYPMARFYADLNTGLTDPTTAPQTLRWLAERTAEAHGTTVEAMLGVQSPATANDADDAGDDWQGKGFDSKEQYDAAPDWERAGYDSAGEFRLAKELAELKASLAPIAKEKEELTKAEAQAKVRAEWEGAIKKVAPAAIAAVKSEMGWQATPEQALAAARKFPALASQPGGLKDAIAAAHVKDIAKAAQERGRGQRPTPPEMPQGERRGGHRELSADERTDIEKLTDRAYELAAS